MTDVGTEPPDVAPRLRRRRVVALTVLTVAVIVIGLFAARWIYGVRMFGGYGDAVSGPVQVGGTFYTGETVTLDGTRRIDLRSITPRVVVNTADASVTVVICTIGTGLIGAATWTSPSCSSVAAFTSGVLDIGVRTGAHDILLAITPRQPGTVQVDGVTVDYRVGIRRGHQHTGEQVTVTARR